MKKFNGQSLENFNSNLEAPFRRPRSMSCSSAIENSTLKEFKDRFFQLSPTIREKILDENNQFSSKKFDIVDFGK